MNILNGTEAFEAMMAGRNIMCRIAGELIEFDDLDQFPATVFAKQGYEFCIKIDEITINGFTFLKPYSLDELEEGQDIFLIGNTGSIVKGQFITEYEELVLAVKNGSVQRDFENAQKQAKAIQSLLGIENELVVKVVDFHTFMKPTAKPKKAPRKKSEDPIEQVEPAPVSNEKAGDVSTDEIETDPVKIVESFTTQINECVKVESVLSLRYSFSANGYLEREHVQHLFGLVEAKLIELDPEQYTPQAETEDLSLEALKKLQQDAEDLIKGGNEQIQADENQITLLNDLLKRASNSQTPAEANALIKYTSEWTEEQRKPLLTAIHNRLNELSASTAGSEEQPPSLMVQIENAKDFTELDCLEIEVYGRHPEIQPKLMGCVKRRRFELENQSSEVAS
ncbi:hypothetical protein WH243_01155 [Acinetobacter sp. MYb177]|uniref:hypothetical protein n=1 Tax=unclassified Acinetobacter TaxID=196816 RepID=UPI0030AA44CD